MELQFDEQIGLNFHSAISDQKLRNGRGGEIRTHDLLYPKQARYQATLRPDLRAK